MPPVSLRPSSPYGIETVLPELRRSSASAGSLRNRVRYRFDNLLSRGTWAVLLWLGVVTLVAVLISSGLLAVFRVDLAGSQENSWLEDFWQSTLRILDSGTMAADVGWGRRVLALLVTVFGLLIAGTLIGLIANGVEERVDAMRRGRSTVVESGHVVILGASGRLPIIVEQLALANRTRRSNAIVVLADREPVDLSGDMRAAVTNLHGSRVVFRWGDRARAQDLAMVALRDARAVIVLADDDGGDAGVVKAVLATGVELGGFDQMPIVAELGDPETSVSLVRACGGAVHPVVAAQSVARITAFALREPGLNQVVEELLDFRGCDLYVRDLGDLAGLSFGETVVHFEKARPIGRMCADGRVELNPEPGIRLGRDDRLIVIADDDEVPVPAQCTFQAGRPPPASPRPRLHADSPPEHVLIVGWNALGAELLASLEEFAASGSTVEVVYDTRLFDPEDLRLPALDRLDVTLTPDRRATWQMGDRATSHLTSIVLLAYRRPRSSDEADSRTLLTLMMLRRDLAARGGEPPRIVVELLDADNVELARMTGADEYVVSDAITSRLITQVAEQPQRRPILLSLYAADGPSVQLVPARELGMTGELGYDEVITTAYAAGMLAIGVRRGHDVELNPRASARVQLDDGDQIVAIA